ncbi:DUF2993 domain-containing protein [Streptomyces sp. TRM66268-LWL]|uniref:DUF2993 domain-containing protein n=1 Tax=Streptomyces polyasparticus TaxID=2767826 RepID=A0ABR7SWC0_9ACTN|nr:DUF2993 domain-containing protein [Streptomyces polyasparticus]MBC9719189.1 DUF2993 domain-containing protein [Streptomyces polyasparticus]
MRGLRITLIIAVILGGLFVAADRILVGFAEDEAADKIRISEGLAEKPDVSINGFPFLTQLAGGELDDVSIGIDDYEAPAEDGKKIRIAELDATMRGVAFSDSYSSATADSADGTARITYDELLKAAKVEAAEVAPGMQAKVVGLSPGGGGKIKVAIEISVFGRKLPPVGVTSTVTVEDGNTVYVHADAMPKVAGVSVADRKMREITDFKQKLDGLPAGIDLKSVQAVQDGVEIAVTGTQVKLVG